MSPTSSSVNPKRSIRTRHGQAGTFTPWVTCLPLSIDLSCYGLQTESVGRRNFTTMGIQFRLEAGDLKPVEDFLSRDHAGTTAVTLFALLVTSATLPQPQSTQA